MYISPVSLSFKNNDLRIKNNKRIEELEQKQANIRWASEGANASLDIEDELELSLRREYESLIAKHYALQGLAEGSNCSLSEEETQRMNELRAIFSIIDEANERKLKANPYNVPESTFYGDWAN